MDISKLKVGRKIVLNLKASDFIGNHYSDIDDCALTRAFKRKFKIESDLTVGGAWGHSCNFDDNGKSYHYDYLTDLFNSNNFRELQDKVKEENIKPNKNICRLEIQITEIKEN